MSKLLSLSILAVATAGNPAIHAQQVLEIDLEAGRTIIDSEFRSMGRRVLAIDRDKEMLYVNDREEPYGIMAFSLKTGDWIRTIRTPEGDGPHEFSQGRTGMVMGRTGGLYVSGLLRVVEYDSLGVPVHNWTPVVPTSKPVCDLGGAPAVPTHRGVVRRGPDGRDEGIGPHVLEGHAIQAETYAEALAIGDQVWNAKIACSGKAAYVVMQNPEAPDSVYVYHLDGRESRLKVPTDFTEDLIGCRRTTRTASGRILSDTPCPTWNQRLFPSMDGRGNVFLASPDQRIAGAVVDPDTGCYAILRMSQPDYTRTASRIYGDSVLVFRDPVEQERRGNRTVNVVYSGGAHQASLHPLRRISGEPCTGMLPSVN